MILAEADSIIFAYYRAKLTSKMRDSTRRSDVKCVKAAVYRLLFFIFHAS